MELRLWVRLLLILSPLIPVAIFLAIGQETADSPSYHIVIYTRTPTPSPVATPSPTPTVVPCIKITNPPNGASVTGTINVTTVDTCPGVWFETLYVDGLVLGSFVPGTVTFNSTTYANGPHTLIVNSMSQNPGSVVLGCASSAITVSNTH